VAPTKAPAASCRCPISPGTAEDKDRASRGAVDKMEQQRRAAWIQQADAEGAAFPVLLQILGQLMTVLSSISEGQMVLVHESERISTRHETPLLGSLVPRAGFRRHPLLEQLPDIKSILSKAKQEQIIDTASAEELNLFRGTAVPSFMLQMRKAPDNVDLMAKVKELDKQLGRVKKQIEEALLLPHPAALASSS
ncbi:luxQ, partial [Symbiodinium sp. CCMP2456]